MGKPGNTGIRRILRAFVFTAQGFGHAWRHEAAFRQEVILTIVLIPIAVWLGQTILQRALLIGVCFIVLIVEFLNSAIEAVVDRFGGDHHELSGRAKDMGSAAVAIAILLLAVTWLLVLFF